MRALRVLMLVPAAIVAVACGRNDSGRADDALKNDLALASQAQPYMQNFNPAEMGYGQPYGYPGYNAYSPYAPPQYPQQQPYYGAAPVRRTTSTGVRRSSSSGVYVAREPVRHTKRDAVIGAGAGAVIGAVSSRDKLKGAIIGAAAGGLLGGIVGHTIDVDK